MSALTFEQLNQIFTVETLMTPRSECRMIEKKNIDVLLDEDLRSYDILPVKDEDQIVGVWVQDSGVFKPLAERWLVSCETPIPFLIDLFIETGYKAFLVIRGQQVVGIVTPADLNKMPMRVYAYNVIGSLEMALAQLVRGYYLPDQERLIASLPEKRQAELRTNLKMSRKDNLDVSIIEHLNLSDLVNVIEITKPLWKAFNLTSRKKIHKSLSGLVKMRNNVMHTVRPLLSKTENEDGITIKKIKDYLDRSQEITNQLSQTKIYIDEPSEKISSP